MLIIGSRRVLRVQHPRGARTAELLPREARDLYYGICSQLPYSTLPANSVEQIVAFRACKNKQKQPPIYFRGGQNMASMILCYTVRRRISWRLPYIVAQLAGRESDFLGLFKTSPGTVFCNICCILLNDSTKQPMFALIIRLYHGVL